jgi:hypothetical protein
MSRKELETGIRELLKHFDIQNGDWPGIHGRTYSGDRVWCLVDTELARILFKLQEQVNLPKDFEDFRFLGEDDL